MLVILKKILCLILVAFAAPFAFAKNVDPASYYRNFDDLKLTDQHGQPFTTEQLDSKITLFNFIYTQCASVCSVQTSELVKIYQSLSPTLKKDIRFVSVSLDPIKDNPNKLKSFASRLKADVDGWYFLSMNFHDLNRLSSKITLFKEDHGKTIYDTLKPKKNPPINKLEEHATGLWLIDKRGLIIQRYVGSPIEVNRLINELNTLHQMQFRN